MLHRANVLTSPGRKEEEEEEEEGQEEEEENRSKMARAQIGLPPLVRPRKTWCDCGASGRWREWRWEGTRELDIGTRRSLWEGNSRDVWLLAGVRGHGDKASGVGKGCGLRLLSPRVEGVVGVSGE